MKQNNVKIAVTGGIGSGKSTVCEYIRRKGYTVCSCDETYAKLLNDGEFIDDIVKVFGEGVVNSDRTLNREALSKIVFSDEEQLKKLNELTHNKIFEEMFKATENIFGVVFYEVPLLFEGGFQDLFDGVIVVLRKEEERIKSIIRRDNSSAESVKLRINRQYNYKNNEFTQYYVIHNDCSFGQLYVKIDNILNKIVRINH